MNIKTYYDLSSLNLRNKLKKLLNEFLKTNKYAFTSIFSYLEVLEVFIRTNKIPEDKIFFITVENDNKDIILFIPLLKFNFFNITIYTFIGGNKFDYNTCIYNNEFKNSSNVIIKDLKNVFATNSIIIFNAILDKFIIQQFKNVFRLNFISVKDKYSFIELGNFEKNVSKKLYKEIIRSEKKLAETAKLFFKESVNEERLIDFIIAKKNEQYKNSGVAILDSKGEQFYRELAKLDISHISAISHNGSIVAAHLGLRTSACYTYLLPVYDTKYRKFSPGWILLFKLLAISKTRGLDKFDLTIGEEGYKSRLRPQQGEIYYSAFASNKILFLLVKFNIFIVKLKIKLHDIKTKYIFK